MSTIDSVGDLTLNGAPQEELETPRESHNPGGMQAAATGVFAEEGTTDREVLPSLGDLHAAITPERLGPYRLATGGSLSAAIALYEWNAKISAAFWTDIGHLEIFIRNAMTSQLAQWSEGNAGDSRWYSASLENFDFSEQADIRRAIERVRRAGKPIALGRVVAELNFGFWRFLTASRYDRLLWKSFLRHSFPGQPRRRPVHDYFARLHRLRNRIAHHEPVHADGLPQAHEDLLILVGWVAPSLSNWIAQQTDVPGLLLQAPVAPKPRIPSQTRLPDVTVGGGSS